MTNLHSPSSDEDSNILSALIQAFSALSIFVFYFGWVWEDSYLQMFGLRATALDFPFYYFLIQGLKVNFPYQIENHIFTTWQIFAWAINLLLVISALLGNTKRFKNYLKASPGCSLVGVTFVLVLLFFSMHYVGSKAGHDRARSILNSPGLLRAVTYKYTKEADPLPGLFSGYLLTLTNDRIYVLGATSLQDHSITTGQNTTLDVTIVPLDQLLFVRTAGYQFTR